MECMKEILRQYLVENHDFWGQISGADLGRLKSDAIIFLYFLLSLQISIT